MVVHFQRTVIGSGRPTPAAAIVFVVVLVVTINCSAMASTGRARTTSSPDGDDVLRDFEPDQQQRQRTFVLSPQTSADYNDKDGKYKVNEHRFGLFFFYCARVVRKL